MLGAALAAIAFVRLWAHYEPGWMLATPTFGRAPGARRSVRAHGHGLALDGDTLFIAGRGELWAYRLME